MDWIQSMAGFRPKKRRWPTLLFLQLLIVTLVQGSGCKVEHCTRQFQQAATTSRRGPAFCLNLRQYSDCLRSTARSCRGHLAYHSTVVLVQNWNGEFNCSYVTSQPVQRHNRVEEFEKSLEPTARGYRNCNYQGKSEMKHCTFYGDPHLVTFNGEFQTCKVAGAWPLIDNAYLAVSVTNEAVVPGSQATATTKVTIIIKGGSDCAPERTYEAAVDSVPASFVDGSQSGGPGEHPVRIIEKEPGRHIEIHAKHLGSVLIIRQVGRYLTFSAKLPKDIAEQGAGHEGLQLCVKGCPLSERIDIPGRFYRSLKGLSKESALTLCREYNLTDYYLDSCMFDLMTTGDPNFSLAASHAQNDFFSLLPEAKLSNRTYESSANSPGRPFILIVLCFIVIIL